MKYNISVIIFLIFLAGCAPNPEQNIEQLNGYWEITQVEKNNKLIKKYAISATVDYFKIEGDLSGFKKKVMPTFQGTYIVSQHHTPFSLKLENDSINIYYINNEVTIKETILKLSKTELIIADANGFIYTYKPSKKIELQ